MSKQTWFIKLLTFLLLGTPLSVTAQTEVHPDLVSRTLQRFEGRVNFVGHGSKSQIADLPELYANLDQLVMQLNHRYGEGHWIAMFGGDSYSAEKRDIAHVMKYLKDRHGIPLFAAQSDVVRGWGGVDRHIDYVSYVPTTYQPKLEMNGEPTLENGKPKMQVVWGGFYEGRAVGPTSLLLGFRPQLSTNMVAVGGGPIAAQEFHFAKTHGVPSTYIRTRALFPEANGPYGSLEPATVSKCGATVAP